MIIYECTKQNNKSTKSIVCPNRNTPQETFTFTFYYTQMVSQLLMQGSPYRVYQCQDCILIIINTLLLIIFLVICFFIKIVMPINHHCNRQFSETKSLSSYKVYFYLIKVYFYLITHNYTKETLYYKLETTRVSLHFVSILTMFLGLSIIIMDFVIT